MSRIALDHMQLNVADYAQAKAFYAKVLKPLGWTLMMEFPEQDAPTYGGFGVDGKPYFWLAGGARQTPRTHVAFGAMSRAEVDAFYKAALAGGAKDNGPPGVRKVYHPNYYSAFVLDPEGHNVEAVFHGAPANPSARKSPKKRVAKAAPRRAAAKKKPAAKRKPAARKTGKRAR
jgi:catechol 2,3-dioxygenase-like lactoylglutathione lyase family enzyme